MRLIDADAFIEAIENERTYLINRGLNGMEDAIVHHILPLIDNAPTIDAEPVVRCGECKWGKPYSDKQLKCNALGLGGLKFPDDFCSYGKRREP